MNKNYLLRTLRCVVATLFVGPAILADNNWDGDSTSSANWSAGNNWYGNVNPGTGSGVDINFNYQNFQWDSNYDYASFADFRTIYFNSSLPHFMNLNNPLTRGMDLFGSDAIVNNSFNGVAFKVDISVKATDPKIKAVNSNLDLAMGNIYMDAANNTIHFEGGSGKSIFVGGALHGLGGITVGSAGLNVYLKNTGNNYTGQTSIDYGTLWNDVDNVISDDSVLYIGDNGIYNKNGKTEFVKSFFGSGVITFGATANLTYNGTDAIDRIFSGVIHGGAGHLVKNGTTKLTLSGTGDNDALILDVNAGTVVLAKTSNSGVHAVGGDVTIGSSATVQLGGTGGDQIYDPADVIVNSGGVFDLNGQNETMATVSLAGTGISSGGALVNNNGATTSTLTLTGTGILSAPASIGGSANVTLNGTLNSSSGTYLTKVGAGILTLGGSVDNANLALTNGLGTTVLAKSSTSAIHALGAGVVVAGGTVRLGGTGDDQIFNSSGVRVNGGVFDLNGKTETVDAFNGTAGTVDNTAVTTASFIVGANNTGGAFNGVIQNSGGGALAFTKSGTGLLTLGGSSANTYSGATTVNAGELDLNKTAGTDAIAGVLTVGDGTGGTDADIVKLLAANQINNAVAVTVVSSGKFDLNSNAETIGSLEGSGNVALGSAQLTAGNANNKDFSGVISGTGAFVKQGTGIQTFSGSAANTYSGATTVNVGELDLNKTAGTDAIAGALTVGDGTGGANADIVKLLAANQINNAVAVTVASSGKLDLNNNAETIGSLEGSGNVALGSAQLTAGNANNKDFSGVISGTGDFVKQGTGIQTFSGASANTYSGATTVNVGELDLNKTAGTDAIAGALTVGDGTGGANADVVKLFAANQINDSAAVTVNSSGKFDLNNNNETIRSLSGSGNVALGSGQLTVANTSDTTFSGTISGTGGLVKQGANKLTLTGNNTYSAATTINAGILALNGTITGGGGISVNSGGTLQGSGTVGGAISGSGFVSPGNSPGILTATQFDPTGGIDLGFEFQDLGDPTWSNAGASGNDVQRLTDATTPFTANLTMANVLDIYLDRTTLSDSDFFRGGFFTDRDSNFTTIVGNADYNFYVKGDGAGGIIFNGENYYTLAQYNANNATSWGVGRSVTQVSSANFAGGTILNGWVQQFDINEIAAAVPEPSTILLFVAGAGIIYGNRRRLFKRS